MRPKRDRTICGSARFVARKHAVRSVSMTFSKRSSLIRSISPSSVIPAEQTSISTGPSSASILANAASIAASSVTSQATG